MWLKLVLVFPDVFFIHTTKISVKEAALKQSVLLALER